MYLSFQLNNFEGLTFSCSTEESLSDAEGCTSQRVSPPAYVSRM